MPGCGSPPPHEEKGDLSVQVTLPATVVFDSLTYQVSGNGIQPIVRNVTIVGSPTTGFAYFSGLPAHPGYDVEVNGTSHDGLTICAATSGTFANPSASNTTFVCGTAGSIAVTVTATSGQCSDRIAMAVQCVAN